MVSFISLSIFTIDILKSLSGASAILYLSGPTIIGFSGL